MAKSSLSVGQKASVGVERSRSIMDQLFSKENPMIVEVFDKNGKLKYREKFHNDITNVGKDSLLNVYFDAATQLTNWYFGVVNNAAFSAFADADTMSSHAGWAEYTGYDETARVAWAPDAASSQSITNATSRTFDINATATLKGIFVTSDSTKSGTSGVLWATAAFSSTVPVTSGDVLKVTYTVNA